MARKQQSKTHLVRPWGKPPSAADVWRFVLGAVADGHTHAEISVVVGLPRARVSSLARTRALPEAVRKLIDRGFLSPRHGEVLLQALPELRESMALRARQGRWSVARLTDAVKGRAESASAGGDSSVSDPNVVSLERELSEALACQVRIVSASDGAGGTLAIQYFSLDELEGILDRLRPPNRW